MHDFIDEIIQSRPYVIAEIGINHNGDISLAKEMIDAAQENGADCVKFQSFIADNYISKIAPKANYQKADESVANLSQREIIKKCQLSTEQAIELKNYAEKKYICFLSTPFEIQSFRSLISIHVDAVKISSCNLTNIPFLEEVADSKIPVLLSTGMGSLTEVIEAVRIFKKSGSHLLLFQCTSNYPSKSKNANLLVINTYQRLFDVPVGFSDHTVSNTAAIVAVGLGAVVIEKHFTTSRKLPGIDQKASIEPGELKVLVKELRDAKLSLGSPLKERTSEEMDTAAALRRSIVAKIDLKKGDILDNNMVEMKRPGDGLPPSFLVELIGKKLKSNVKKDEKILLDYFI